MPGTTISPLLARVAMQYSWLAKNFRPAGTGDFLGFNKKNFRTSYGGDIPFRNFIVLDEHFLRCVHFEAGDETRNDGLVSLRQRFIDAELGLDTFYEKLREPGEPPLLALNLDALEEIAGIKFHDLHGSKVGELGSENALFYDIPVLEAPGLH